LFFSVVLCCAVEGLELHLNGVRSGQTGNQVKEHEMGGRGNAYNILVGVHEGKRAFGRPRHRWDDNIRMDHREIRWEGVDWIHLAQDRNQWQVVVNAVMNFRVP
jgi:hypothetical protein